MIPSLPPPPASDALEALHTSFLAILDGLRGHARVVFRDRRCPHARDDAVAEAVALAWRWYAGLASNGKDPAAFPGALAALAARAVRCGRRLCGQERARDVLSPTAQVRKGFAVCSLSQGGSLSGGFLGEALRDNTQSPVPEQAAFRIDFPVWLTTLCERDRRVCEDLMAGNATVEVARRYGLSPGRVSQLRRQFLDGWRRFCGDHQPDGPRAPT